MVRWQSGIYRVRSYGTAAFTRLVYLHMCTIYLFLLTSTDAQDGVVKIHWCHSASLLYTACLDGIVRLWDSRNGSSVRTWEGHTDHLLDLDVTRFVEINSSVHLYDVVYIMVYRDDSTIVTACEDCTARIFSHH